MDDTAEGLRKAARRVFWEAKNIDAAARKAREDTIFEVINLINREVSSEFCILAFSERPGHPDHDKCRGRVDALRRIIVSIYARFGVRKIRPLRLLEKCDASNHTIDPKRACSESDYLEELKASSKAKPTAS